MKLLNFYTPVLMMIFYSRFVYIFSWTLGIAVFIGVNVTLLIMMMDAAKGKYDWINKLNPIYGFDRPLTEREKLWGVSKEEIAAFKIRKALSGRASLS